MYNYFAVIGPSDDPARIKRSKAGCDLMKKEAKTSFLKKFWPLLHVQIDYRFTLHSLISCLHDCAQELSPRSLWLSRCPDPA
jgi:hypothetical protein